MIFVIGVVIPSDLFGDGSSPSCCPLPALFNKCFVSSKGDQRHRGGVKDFKPLPGVEHNGIVFLVIVGNDVRNTPFCSG